MSIEDDAPDAWDADILPRKPIIIVRHAVTPANLDRMVYAVTPDASLEISPQGISQGRILGPKLGGWLKAQGVESASVWTSTYKRTQQTWEEAASFLDIAIDLHQSHNLRERDYGLCDGMSETEMNARYAMELHAYQTNPFYGARPGGESKHDVVIRAQRFLAEEALPQLAASGNDALIIFTHSVTQRALAMPLIGADEKWFETSHPNNCEAWLIAGGKKNVIFGGFAMTHPQNPIDGESAAPMLATEIGGRGAASTGKLDQEIT